MACFIRDEPESLISGTLNKVNTMRNLSNQVPGGVVDPAHQLMHLGHVDGTVVHGNYRQHGTTPFSVRHKFYVAVREDCLKALSQYAYQLHSGFLNSLRYDR